MGWDWHGQLKFTLSKGEITRLTKDLRLNRTQGKAIGQKMVEQVEARFNRKGAPAGQAWPERWKKSAVTKPMMQSTGTLKKSFSRSIEVTDADTSRIKISIGSDVPYAAAQQQGVSEIKGNPVLYVPITDKGVRQRSKSVKIGRLKDGELQVFKPSRKGMHTQNGKKGEWENGTPDAIFLAKVKLPARPMLPDTTMEQGGQIKVYDQQLKNG